MAQPTQPQFNPQDYNYGSMSGAPYNRGLSYADAMRVLTAKGYPQDQIDKVMRGATIKTPRAGGPNSIGYNVADRYNIDPGTFPAYKAPSAAPATAAPTTPKTTTPAAPTETPAQKARRLANEGAASYFKTAYGKTALPAGDPYGVMSDYNRYVAEALKAIPAAETNINLNYGDLFNKSMTANTTEERNKLTQAVNQFTPYGWESNYFGETSDDPILNEILKQQYGDIETTLSRNLGRGTMSQGAFDYAMGQLGTLEAPGALTSAANTTLQGIGGGVLSGYRGNLTDMLEDFNKNISGYSLGQQINPQTFQNEINQYAGGVNMRGDIMKALGNTQLYDPNALMSKAGSVTGPSNQPVIGSTPGGTGTAQDEEDRRTIGTSGVY